VGAQWNTVYGHFVKWVKARIFEDAYKQLVQIYTTRFKHVRSRIITDCTFIKNVYGRDCVGPSCVDRGRKASKMSIIADEVGVVLAASFHRGNKCDYKAFLHTLTQSHVLRPFAHGKRFYADKAYDNSICDAVIKKFGMQNFCSRKGRTDPPDVTRERIIIEHVFSWLDKYRRLIVRYDQNISSYKSFTCMALSCRLAMILTTS
jgi:transposase